MSKKVGLQATLFILPAAARCRRWLLAVLGVWSCLIPVFSAASDKAAITITYKGQYEDREYLAQYPLELLKLALEHSPRTYRLRSGLVEQAQNRALTILKEGEIDVMWTMTSREREALLRPVRIPIYRGLIGWRLLMIKASRTELFASIERPEQLKSLSAGLRYDWPDTEILRANGYWVTGSPSYTGLFKMLELQRIDYFPRGLSEVWTEAEMYADKGLVVEPHLLLHYPVASYFFVRKESTQLAEDIRIGLEAVIANKRFEQLFQRYYGDDIEKTRLAARRVFLLHNPLLPEDTPLDRKELWFYPAPALGVSATSYRPVY